MIEMANVFQVTFPANYRYLRVLNHIIVATMEIVAEGQEVQTSSTIVGELSLAAHEICTNIIDHAYGGAENKFITVDIAVNEELNELQVMIKDTGCPFNPLAVEWPPYDSWQVFTKSGTQYYQLIQIPEPDFEQERGRGLFLILALLEKVFYFSAEGKNCWCLVKSINDRSDEETVTES